MERYIEYEETEVIKTTDDAMLLTLDGAETWVPKSLLHADSDVYEEGDIGTVWIPEWWAIQEQLV
jgi:hypothetical protein